MKVFELEFNEGVSLKEIKAELDYYRSVGDVVRTKINGEMVYSNDENYEETMYRLELGLSKEEYEGYKKTKGEINKLETCIGTAGSIENYGYYRYYFGLASRYVKSEKKDEFFDFILSNFSIYKNSFVLAVQLMLVINNTDLGVYNEINNILNAHRSARSNEFFEYAIDVDVIGNGDKGPCCNGWVNFKFFQCHWNQCAEDRGKHDHCEQTKRYGIRNRSGWSKTDKVINIHQHGNNGCVN